MNHTEQINKIDQPTRRTSQSCLALLASRSLAARQLLLLRANYEAIAWPCTTGADVLSKTMKALAWVMIDVELSGLLLNLGGRPKP
jgi:hypothetical protein